MTKSDIEDALVFIRNPDTQFPDTIEMKTQDIEGYMMKGMWYFDKRLGELKYRLLALAPMGKDIFTLRYRYWDWRCIWTILGFLSRN